MASCLGMLLTPIAGAQSHNSWTHWFNDTQGSGAPPPGSASPGSSQPTPRLPGGVAILTSEAAFDAACPGLPIEDFEESPVPASGVTGCDEPVDASSNDGCFAPGDILAGLAVRTFEGIRAGCPGECSMAVLGDGLIGNPDVVTGPNFFVDSLLVEFPGGVGSAGMVFHIPVVETLNLTVTTTSGSFPTTASATPAGTFWGIGSVDPILSIRAVSPAGAGELVDNVRFSTPNCAAPAVPTMSRLGLLALAGLLLAAGALSLRRSLTPIP